MELAGIVRGGGDGVLDLDVVRVNFPYEVQNLTAPILPVMSSCERSGLETPVNVRHLLGQSASYVGKSSCFAWRIKTYQPQVCTLAVVAMHSPDHLE